MSVRGDADGTVAPMTDITPTKITSLPKWAQTHIARLQIELERATALAEQRFAGDEDTDTVVVAHLSLDGRGGDLRVPTGTAIRFTLGSDTVQARVVDGELDLQVIWGGAIHHMNIEPVVSNVVRLRITD